MVMLRALVFLTVWFVVCMNCESNNVYLTAVTPDYPKSRKEESLCVDFGISSHASLLSTRC